MTEGNPPYQDMELPDEAASAPYHLVLSYLAFNCYSNTVKALLASEDQSSASTLHSATSSNFKSPSTPSKSTAAEKRTTRSSSRTAGQSASPRKKSASDRRSSQQEQMDEDGDLEMNEAADVEPQQSRNKPLASSVLKQLPAGHTDTLMGFVRSLDARKALCRLVVDGKIIEAMEACRQHFPGLMANVDLPSFAEVEESQKSTTVASLMTAYDPITVAFHLHCQHFIELVRGQAQAEALSYAQTILSKFGRARPLFLEYLRDVVALLAYQDPFHSPVSQFLDQQYREDVASYLNSAVLEQSALPVQPMLEKLVQHGTLLREVLNEQSVATVKDKKLNKVQRWELRDLVRSDV